MNNTVRAALLNLNRQPPLAIDELSIIDRQFNQQGHTSLAAIYGKNAASAHIDVGQPGFDTDNFFLWLQALYAVGCLKLRALPEDLPYCCPHFAAIWRRVWRFPALPGRGR